MKPGKNKVTPPLGLFHYLFLLFTIVIIITIILILFVLF